jgi:phasin
MNSPIYGIDESTANGTALSSAMQKDCDMTNAAAMTGETIEFPAFDTAKTADQFRAFTEKGVEQSKEAYAKFKANAEDAQKALETTIETVRAATNELSLKSIEAARTNADAGFSHLQALVAVKSLAELIELQTAFARKSFETAVEQAKDLQAASTRAGDEIARPLKEAFEKTTRELKFA